MSAVKVFPHVKTSGTDMEKDSRPLRLLQIQSGDESPHSKI